MKKNKNIHYFKIISKFDLTKIKFKAKKKPGIPGFILQGELD